MQKWNTGRDYIIIFRSPIGYNLHKEHLKCALHESWKVWVKSTKSKYGTQLTLNGKRRKIDCLEGEVKQQHQLVPNT